MGALTLTLIKKRLPSSFIWVADVIKDSRARGVIEGATKIQSDARLEDRDQHAPVARPGQLGREPGLA